MEMTNNPEAKYRHTNNNSHSITQNIEILNPRSCGIIANDENKVLINQLSSMYKKSYTDYSNETQASRNGNETKLDKIRISLFDKNPNQSKIKNIIGDNYHPLDEDAPLETYNIPKIIKHNNKSNNVFCEIANMEITFKEREMTPPHSIHKDDENDIKFNISYSKERVEKIRNTLTSANKLFNIKTNKDSMIKLSEGCII